MVAHERKQYQQAKQLLAESVATLESFGELRYRHFGLGYLASTLHALRYPAEARQLMWACLTQRELIGDPRTILHLLYHIRGIFGLMDTALGREAGRYLQNVVATCRENADAWGIALSLSQLGYIHYQLSEYDEAKGCFCEALQTARRLLTPSLVLEAVVGLTLLLTQMNPPSPENQALAFTRLTMVLNHPTTTGPTYDRAAALLAELEKSSLPPEAVSAAQERAAALPLEMLVEEVLSAS